tara:strand:- start:310 stop:1686 length:1377 start_codon:yes stop_codon:yes gene_type:complete
VTENNSIAWQNMDAEFYDYFGFSYTWQEGDLPIIDVVHPNIEFKNKMGEQEQTFNDIKGRRISEINGKDVKKLSESDFEMEFNKNSINFRVNEEDNLFIPIEQEFAEKSIYIVTNIKEITDINSKTASFNLIFETQIVWKDERFNEIFFTVLQELIISDPDYINLEEGYLFCDYDTELFSSKNYPLPNVYPEKFISNVKTDFEPKIRIRYFPKEQCGEEFVCSENEEKFGSVELERKHIREGTIYSEMDLRKFPFDRQKLKIIYNVRQDREVPIFLFQSFFDDNNSTARSNSLNDEEWFFGKYETGYEYYYEPEWEAELPQYFVALNIERKQAYYLFKIMLPIVFLLILSCSIFWIAPTQLESRVTVSIVVLLSLIAYNFVIDADIPKLGYLTFLDNFVLVSYLFAGIPTIQTVISNNLVSRHDETLAKKIDNFSKVLFPVLYLSTIVIISISYSIIV